MLNQTVNISNYNGIMDVFISDMYEAWPLPPNLTQEIFNNVTFYQTFQQYFTFGSEKERKLLPAPLLSFIIQNMDAIAFNGTNYPS